MYQTTHETPLTHSADAAAQPAERVAARSAMVVVAAVTDDELAAPTLAVARALSAPRPVNVLYVFEVSNGIPEAPLLAAEIAEDLRDPQTRRVQERGIRRRLKLDAGLAATWPLEMAVGEVPTCIMRAGENHHADLILVGLHHHNIVARMIGNDALGELVSLAGRPVLAVNESLSGRPRRVVVGMDFTPASVRAAHVARRVMADDGVMYLVHVRSDRPARTDDEIAERAVRRRGVEASFDSLTRALHPQSGQSVVSVIVEGNATAELEKFCDSTGADMLAVGTQQLGLIERIRLGSVTRSLLRRAKCSVLVAPAEVLSSGHHA